MYSAGERIAIGDHVKVNFRYHLGPLSPIAREIRLPDATHVAGRCRLQRSDESGSHRRGFAERDPNIDVTGLLGDKPAVLPVDFQNAWIGRCDFDETVRRGNGEL
jgi:hypothetical protein